MFVLLSALSVVLPTLSALPAPNTNEHCRCVPNQWEGILSSTDREFDLKGGQTGNSDNTLQVHYDFDNKRFAMLDLRTGSRAIADYEKGYKYIIRGDICHGIHTGEAMRQMCLPETADFLGEYALGTSVQVDLWRFDGPFNTSLKTSVLHDDCVPVSEEIYMARGGYVSLTSAQYLNIKLGIHDNGVFTPPADCVMQAKNDRRGPAPDKRMSNAHDASELLKALRQRLEILN